MEDLLRFMPDRAHWAQALTSIVLAYVLTQLIAMVYAWSHRGLSYSRSLTQSLVVAGIVASMLMLAIGNSLARGIGIVGTLALVRFRINLRDPMDMLFVFAAFAAGIAAGAGGHATAVMGTLIFVLVVAILRLTSFGAHRDFDGVLRLQLPARSDSDTALSAALQRFCRAFALITLRDVAQGARHERIYQISLRTARDEVRLLEAVTAIEGATGVTISMQEATLEV